LFCAGFQVFLLLFSHLPESVSAALPWMGASDLVGAAPRSGDRWQWLYSGYSSEAPCVKLFMLSWVCVCQTLLCCMALEQSQASHFQQAQKLSKSSPHHAVLGNLVTALLPSVLY